MAYPGEDESIRLIGFVSNPLGGLTTLYWGNKQLFQRPQMGGTDPRGRHKCPREAADGKRERGSRKWVIGEGKGEEK